MSYLQSLSVFFAVAEEKSFSGAAKKLNLTQPTVSFHIDNLEKKLGCPLFVRTARGVSLTTYGEGMYENTSKIHTILAETQKRIQAMVSGAAGKITIGASTIPSEFILPSCIAQFIACHPGIQITLTSGDSRSILSAFKQGDFPVAIIGSKPEELTSYPLWEDELVLIAHPELCRQLPDRPALADILHYPFITRLSSSGSRNAIYAALQQQGIQPAQLNTVLQVSSNTTLKAAVLNKTGLAFISRWAIEQELHSGQLQIIPLAGFNIRRTFYAVAHLPLMPACAHQFWEFLLAAASASGGTTCFLRDITPSR